MSAGVPDDLKTHIKHLEIDALDLLANEKYDLALKIYSIVYLSLKERQYSEGRRIHLGAPLHMKGITYILIRNNEESLKHFLLAFITDIINNPVGSEDNSFTAPAYRALTYFFDVSRSSLNSIKQNVILKISNRDLPFDPYQFLDNSTIFSMNIASLANKIPNDDIIYDVKKSLFKNYPITSSGQILLNKSVDLYATFIIRKAADIAKNKGRVNSIEEEDIEEAINEVENKK